MKQYVVRMATNCTARRNQLPIHKGKGRPRQYGAKVRPLPGKWKDREIAATTPDHQAVFDQDGRQIQVSLWHDLVLPGTPVAADAATFSIYVFYDPLYEHPLTYLAAGSTEGSVTNSLWRSPRFCVVPYYRLISGKKILAPCALGSSPGSSAVGV